MDRTLAVRTPESIAFSYELAGIGSRFLAVALDFAIQIGVMTLIIVVFAILSAGDPAQKAAAAAAKSPHWAVNVAIGFIVFVVFLILFGYFILFEAFWNGQTPGKRALGIRVVRDGGYPLDFTASLVRNLIRVGEAAFGSYAIAAVSAMLSPENKRLGDMAAGTIVVRDARMESPERLLAQVREAPSFAATAYASGEERELIHRFLDRRAGLEPQRRRWIAHQLAERVRGRVPIELRELGDEELLERL
jgi:uncharacterized RDD family membrane protein YckC